METLIGVEAVSAVVQTKIEEVGTVIDGTFKIVGATEIVGTVKVVGVINVGDQGGDMLNINKNCSICTNKFHTCLHF